MGDSAADWPVPSRPLVAKAAEKSATGADFRRREDGDVAMWAGNPLPSLISLGPQGILGRGVLHYSGRYFLVKGMPLKVWWQHLHVGVSVPGPIRGFTFRKRLSPST